MVFLKTLRSICCILKNYVIGHPFQAAWFHPYPFLISRETLFHYYIWGFLHLFGFNILSYEAALLLLWYLSLHSLFC